MGLLLPSSLAGPAAAATAPDGPARPIAVTMGDPAGIGPEVVVEALAGLGAAAAGPACVIGDAAVLRRAWAQVRAARPAALPATVDVRELDDIGAAAGLPAGAIGVWTPPALRASAAAAPGTLATRPMGVVDAVGGRAAADCIEAAARLAGAGQAAGIVTAPIHKEALAAAGLPWPGHTEMLQSLAAPPGVAPPPVRMMLANPQLRVVLVTIHVSLRRAIEMLDVERVWTTLRIADAALRHDLGIDAPRIAVAGLNPHAGEGGLFGDEEQRIIAPAIVAARAAGIDARGPFAADTVFMRARHAPPHHPGEFDAVVAMTHDHGLIPVKYLGVDDGVNVTLGLPWRRASPDHGTAFDIAGRGLADPSSLRAALAFVRDSERQAARRGR